MTIENFRQKVAPNSEITVKNKKFTVREIIKFRLNDGSFYIKCFLNDDFIIAEDSDRNVFIFGREVVTSFRDTPPKTVSYEGKNYKFLFEAHGVAEEIWGEEIYKKGYSETFWDFEAKDGSYLSLGIADESKERLDLLGKVTALEEVEI